MHEDMRMIAHELRDFLERVDWDLQAFCILKHLHQSYG